MKYKEEFEELSLFQQGTLLFGYGEYLYSFRLRHLKICLYVYNRELYEVWVHPQRNFIENIEKVDTHTNLDVYIKNIDLEGLF